MLRTGTARHRKDLLDAPAEIDGASLETLVLQHLRAEMSWRNSEGTISYWRTATGLEVDFVV